MTVWNRGLVSPGLCSGMSLLLQLCITLSAYWSGGCIYPIAYVNAVISRKIPVMLLFEPRLCNFYTVTVLNDLSTFTVMQQYGTETGILEKVKITSQKIL